MRTELIAVALLLVGVTISCGSTEQIEVRLDCPSIVDNRVDLGTYLANPATNQEPPLCTVVAGGGTQPYGGQAVTVNGIIALSPINLDSTVPAFVLPPQTVGTHPVQFELRDASGAHGVGTTQLEWGWASSYGADVRLESVVLNTDGLIEVEHRISFDIVPLTAHPRLFPNTVLDEHYALTIDFGDGTQWSASYPVSTIDEFVKHSYPRGSDYIARATVEGGTYGQSATAVIHIRDDGVRGVTLYNPELAGTEWQLASAELPEPLHATIVEDTFDDSRFNRTVVINATVFGGSDNTYQVDIEHIDRPDLTQQPLRDAVNLKIGPLPTTLVTGQSMALDIAPRVTLHADSTRTAYTAETRIFAMRQSPPNFDAITGESHQLQVPLPVHKSDLITIELRIKSDLIAEDLLMRWTYAHSDST